MRWVSTNPADILVARGGLVLAAIAYALLFLSAASLFWIYGGVVSDTGWTWQTSDGGVFINSVDSHGPATALTPGAKLLAINGDSRASQFGPRPWLQTVRPGQSYRVRLETPDRKIQEALLKMSRRISERDLQMGLCDFLLSLAFAAVGFLVWANKPNDVTARWCTLGSLLFGFYMIASAVGPLSPQLSGFPLAVYFLLKSISPFHMVAGCALFARLPAGEKPSRNWRLGLQAITALGVLTWLVIFPQRFFPYLGLEWRLPYLAGLDLWTRPELAKVAIRHGSIVVCGVYLVLVTRHNYRRLTSQAMRLRIQWVVFGTILGIAPGFLYSFIVSAGDATHLIAPDRVRDLVRFYSLPTLSLAAIPVCLAYAILCHRLMGIRIALVNSMQFLFARRIIQVATLLPAIPLGVYLWTHRTQPLTDSLVHPSGAIPVILLALALLFRKELLDACERLLARLRFDRKCVMDDLLETLFAQRSTEDVVREAAARIDRAFRPEAIFIVAAGIPAQSPAPAIPLNGTLAATLSHRGAVLLERKLLKTLPVAERQEIESRNLALAAPIAGGLNTDISGIVLLGERISAEGYRPTDLELVEDVARQIYLAFKMQEVEASRDQALRAREQAEESGRNRTQFLAQISHELRNPLSGMVGLTDLLLDTPLRDDQKQYAEILRRSSEWVVTIANDMLDLARFDAGRLKLEQREFPWLPMLEDLTVLAAERARHKDLEVILRVDPETPATGLADPDRVRQVLFNLLDNAVKFTERGWVLLHARPASGRISLSVEDTGPGIPESYRTRIFRPFEQTATGVSRPSGAGLGLAISKRLVDAMGGDLTLDSHSAGRGARFHVTFPVAAAQREAQQPLCGLRLLCIDPLPVSLHATTSNLASLGASVTGLTFDSDLDVTAQYDAVLLSPANSREAMSTIRNCRRMLRVTPILVLHRWQQGIPDAECEGIANFAQLRRPALRSNLVAALQTLLSRLPRHPPLEVGIQEAPLQARVLIIEDHAETLRVMCAMLQRLGCQVHPTETGAGGLQLLQSQHFDLVLVDGQMPDLDGIEFTRRVRSIHGSVAGIPIVAITGHASPDWRASFFDAGADDYVLKPTSVAELREVIRMQLRTGSHRTR